MKNRQKYPAFMGRTHVLLSLAALFAIMLIPVEAVQITLGKLKSDVMLFIAGIVVLTGGALFPDLDNDKSTAGYALGPLGSIFTIFMKSTSMVTWNLYHGKADQVPSTMHRYLWHAPIIGVGLGALFYFGLQTGNYNIFTNLSNSIQTGTFSYFARNNAVLLLFAILMFMAVLVGSSTIVYRLINLIPAIPDFTKYLLPVITLGYIFTTSYDNLRLLGVCFGLGYALHCIEDCFADTGNPALIFPIPQFWRKKVWGRIRLVPMTVQTGSLVNTIVDFVALGVAILLFVMVVS